MISRSPHPVYLRPQTTRDVVNQKLAHDADNVLICPRCGDVMHEPFVALSRVYSKTKICPDCGHSEAAMPDERWALIPFVWDQQRNGFERQLEDSDEEYAILKKELEKESGYRKHAEAQWRLAQDKIKTQDKQLEKNRATFRELQDQIVHQDEQLKSLVNQLLHNEDT